jgi:hypothetical protein
MTMTRRRKVMVAALSIAAATLQSSCGKTSPAAPTTAQPTATAEPTPVPCGDPLPPPLSHMNMSILLRTGLYWTLDSTPIVHDGNYCRAIGYTDGRRDCPTRPEGHPQRFACDLLAVGKAVDTGRPGPTWRRDGSLCTGIASGCDNDPDNQFHVLVYWQGQGNYTACAENSACGSIFANGPH